MTLEKIFKEEMEDMTVLQPCPSWGRGAYAYHYVSIKMRRQRNDRSTLETSLNDCHNLDDVDVAIPTSQIRILTLESLNNYTTIMQLLSRRDGFQKQIF